MVGCSTCGRELAYIAQYDRLYCYSCRAYAPREVRPCPKCGRALVYVPQYQRYYCYGCQEYKQPATATPQATEAQQKIANPCPTCGKELTFIPQYNRHYCYSCRAYAPPKQEAPAAAKVQAKPQVSTTHAIVEEAKPAAVATREAIFTREELDAASKDQLMRWCQDYGLDASGMKYELRLRIMEYMKGHGVTFKGGPPNGESAPAEGQVKAAGADGGNIVIEPITEDEGREGEAASPSQVVEQVQPTPSTTSSTPGSVTPQVQAPSVPSQQYPFRAAVSPQACPTCGGPLSYISQYNRHYCYRCQAYAPKAWETPAARPTPSAQPATFQAPAAVTRVQPSTATGLRIEVQQGNVLVGIYMIIVGLILYALYEGLYNFPREFQLIPPSLPVEVGFALRFLGYFFVALGTVASLYILRQRTEGKV